MRPVLLAAAVAAGVSLLFATPASADQVIPDDLIVQGSHCVGLDCVNNESFGFDTLRLKENNTRIKFDDTSTSVGFPANDWTLSANEAPSGGASRFMLVDDTAGRVPFSVSAGAPADALVISASGDVRAGRLVSQRVATLNQAPADADRVLKGLRTLDLSTATFTAGPGAPRHLGPTAEDFHLAFGLGADDGTIAPADMAGVALAAVKALDARVTALPSGSQGTPAPAGATGPRGPAGPAGPAGPRQARSPAGGSRGSSDATSASRGAWPGSSVRSASCSRAAPPQRAPRPGARPSKRPPTAGALRSRAGSNSLDASVSIIGSSGQPWRNPTPLPG